MTLCKIKSVDGENIEFIDDIIGSGAMKDVYFSLDKKYVVAFFRDTLDSTGRERLEMIIGLYREKIFNNEQGEYWKSLFCWPEKIVEYKGKVGIVMPTYQAHFFFDHGSVNNDFLNKV